MVRVKIAELPGGEERANPEYDDCRRIATEAGVPIMDVMAEAKRLSARLSPLFLSIYLRISTIGKTFVLQAGD
jgi:hypothetical protein